MKESVRIKESERESDREGDREVTERVRETGEGVRESLLVSSIHFENGFNSLCY